MTVSQLQNSMSIKEFNYWAAYYNAEHKLAENERKQQESLNKQNPRRH